MIFKEKPAVEANKMFGTSPECMVFASQYSFVGLSDLFKFMLRLKKVTSLVKLPYEIVCLLDLLPLLSPRE